MTRPTLRSPGLWLTLVVAQLALHAGLSLSFPHAGWTTSAGICGSLALAFGRCWYEHAHARPDMRWRWRLLAVALLLWISAFVALAYLQTFGPHEFAPDLAISLFLMLRSIPILLLVARTGETDDAIRFRAIDFSLSAMAIALIGILLFPGAVGGSESFVTEPQSLTYHEIQNYALALFAIVSFFGQARTEERRFFALLSGFLLSYAVTASFVNHWIIIALAPPPGSILIMPADFPQVLFVLLAVAFPLSAAHPVNAVRSRLAQGISLMQPVLLCIALMGLAFAVSRIHFGIGLSAGLSVLILYAARSTMFKMILTQTQLELGEAHDRLRALANIDSLTGLPNRRCLDERLDAEWRRGARTNTPLAVLLIDVDSFKSFNDSAGHLAGDDCLRVVATVMTSCIKRQADFLARFGGEEFVVLIPFGEREGARQLAEQIRMAIVQRAYPRPESSGGIVTVSIGLAAMRPVLGMETVDDLLREADAALYRAKSLGRNRVE